MIVKLVSAYYEYFYECKEMAYRVMTFEEFNMIKINNHIHIGDEVVGAEKVGVLFLDGDEKVVIFTSDVKVFLLEEGKTVDRLFIH